MENYSSMMEATIKVNGKMIKCKDTEKCIILTVLQPTKDYGKKAASMETVFYSMTVHKILIINLTITTSHKSKTNGSAIKESSKWTVSMEKVK